MFDDNSSRVSSAKPTISAHTESTGVFYFIERLIMTLFLTCSYCSHQEFIEIETVIEVTQRFYIVGEDGKLESIEENNVTFERQSTLLCDNCKRIIKQR